MAQLIRLSTPPESGVTYDDGAPTGDPGNGPIVYVNNANGDVYSWNGTTWVLLSQTPGAIPVYDGIEDAMSNGLVSGQKFKLSTTNIAGGLPGSVVELL